MTIQDEGKEDDMLDEDEGYDWWNEDDKNDLDWTDPREFYNDSEMDDDMIEKDD